MELFKSKENCKEKYDSNNNWKIARSKMILEWHLFLKLSSGFVRTMASFVGKHLSFYPKDVCLFSVFFIWMKMSCQVCLIKYLENEISNSTSHKK